MRGNHIPKYQYYILSFVACWSYIYILSILITPCMYCKMVLVPYIYIHVLSICLDWLVSLSTSILVRMHSLLLQGFSRCLFIVLFRSHPCIAHIVRNIHRPDAPWCQISSSSNISTVYQYKLARATSAAPHHEIGILQEFLFVPLSVLFFLFQDSACCNSARPFFYHCWDRQHILYL